MKKDMGKAQKGGGRGRRGAGVPFLERLSRCLDIPADVLVGGLTLELRGRGELYISGCRRILYYSTECISLALRDSVLTVEGCRLSCTTYYSSQVGICGRVDSIAFSRPDANCGRS